MGIKAKLGAGFWDFLVCQDCGHYWAAPDTDLEWTDEPEVETHAECPGCRSDRIAREERG